MYTYIPIYINQSINLCLMYICICIYMRTVPASHSPHDVKGATEVVRGAHKRHAARPSNGWYVLAEQTVQRAAPVSGCLLPAGHGVHAPGRYENGRLC